MPKKVVRPAVNERAEILDVMAMPCFGKEKKRARDSRLNVIHINDEEEMMRKGEFCCGQVVANHIGYCGFELMVHGPGTFKDEKADYVLKRDLPVCPDCLLAYRAKRREELADVSEAPCFGMVIETVNGWVLNTIHIAMKTDEKGDRCAGYCGHEQTVRGLGTFRESMGEALKRDLQVCPRCLEAYRKKMKEGWEEINIIPPKVRSGFLSDKL